MDESRVRELVANARVEAPTPFHVFGEDPIFPARFRIGETAAVAQGLAASAAARIHALRTGDEQSVTVDVGPAAATLVCFDYERVNGEPMPPWVIPSTNGMYQCEAGDWIYLQGQLPHLHEGILDLLGCEDSIEAVAAAVAKWDAVDLEDALAERRLCGARARTSEEWREHPQGAFLDSLPVVKVTRVGDADPQPMPPGRRPLEGIRALEFARILAGPMTGRTLAEHGAEVLNVSSTRLDDFWATTVITGHGKRSTFIEVDQPDGAARIRELIADCDVFIDGNRAGALAAQGLGPDELTRMRPGLVYVSVNCYGHGGPWRERRGWEQLAQMVSGMAIGQGGPEQPQIVPPGAPNDFITGFVAAYGAMVALERRAVEGGSWRVEASLSQTAGWIVRNGTIDPAGATGVGAVDQLILEEDGPLGRMTHLGSPVRMGRTPPRWERQSPARGADEPAWLSA